MRTREQERMQAAWECLVERFGSDPSVWAVEDRAKKYLTAMKKTPARIHTCGLGQALAFLRSRSDDILHKAEGDLSRLTLQLLGEPEGNLLMKVCQGDTPFFFLATEEAMAICGWLTLYMKGAGVKSEDEEEIGDQDQEENSEEDN